MRALELNLASRPFRNNVPIWTAFAVLAAGIVLSTAWNLRSWLDVTHKLGAVQASIGSSEKAMADLDRRDAEASVGVRAFDVKILQAQADKVNEIIMRRSLSWTQLFNNLEKVVPYEVRMISIHPTFGARDEGRAARTAGAKPVNVRTVPVIAEGVAQSLDAFLELERALIVDTHFANVEPVRTEAVVGTPEIRFQLNFLYDPDGRLGQEHPELPHVLEAARKAAAEGGEAPAPPAAPAAEDPPQ